MWKKSPRAGVWRNLLNLFASTPSLSFVSSTTPTTKACATDSEYSTSPTVTRRNSISVSCEFIQVGCPTGYPASPLCGVRCYYDTSATLSVDNSEHAGSRSGNKAFCGTTWIPKAATDPTAQLGFETYSTYRECGGDGGRCYFHIVNGASGRILLYYNFDQ